MAEEKLFPKDRILTASARDYVESIGRSIRDYKLIGVQKMTHYTHDLASFCIDQIPVGTEVITDYRFTNREADSTIAWAFMAGTALVPRETYHPFQDISEKVRV